MTERRPRTPPDDRPAPSAAGRRPAAGRQAVRLHVARRRRPGCGGCCGTRRIGHAGTLDPMATGLLVLAVDRSTKLLGPPGPDRQDLSRRRSGWGSRPTPTTPRAWSWRPGPVDGRDRDDIGRRHCRDSPGRSDAGAESRCRAIKVEGGAPTTGSRSGETVELAARPVTVARFELLRPTRRQVAASGAVRAAAPAPEACSTSTWSSTARTGTYVRSLARDLGAALGVGGHLTRLRRTRVGPFDRRGRGRRVRMLTTISDARSPMTSRSAHPGQRRPCSWRSPPGPSAREVAERPSAWPAHPAGRYRRDLRRARRSGSLVALVRAEARPGPCSAGSTDSVDRDSAAGRDRARALIDDRRTAWNVGAASTRSRRVWGRCVLTIGVFDGVHRGHQALIRQAVEHRSRAGVADRVDDVRSAPVGGGAAGQPSRRSSPRCGAGRSWSPNWASTRSWCCRSRWRCPR